MISLSLFLSLSGERERERERGGGGDSVCGFLNTSEIYKYNVLPGSALANASIRVVVLVQTDFSVRTFFSSSGRFGPNWKAPVRTAPGRAVRSVLTSHGDNNNTNTWLLTMIQVHE